LPFPLVKDFKRLEEGDQGPNTGSMGSFSDSDGLLPFITGGERDKALDIMQKTVKIINRQAGTPYCGFLYGQFMATRKGLRLIEYNVRPGDPEILNTMKVLDGELLELFRAMLENRLGEAGRAVDFTPHATICKFLVPDGYPFEPVDPFYMHVEEEKLLRDGISVDYSCTLAEERAGLYHPGPRAVALTASGSSIPDACARVEKAIDEYIDGDKLIYRRDIGTAEQLERIKTFRKAGYEEC